jgi:hypothetical protein
MRYTGSVSNAFVQSMAHTFEQALRLMEAALTDCPDELWQIGELTSWVGHASIVPRRSCVWFVAVSR